MGHATVTNLSKLINRHLRQGPVSIKVIVDDMLARRMKLQAAEGAYDDAPMLGMVTEQILGILHSDGQVVPRPTTNAQRRIWKEHARGESTDWENGDDGRGGEQGIFDSIPWHPLRKRFNVIHQVSN